MQTAKPSKVDLTPSARRLECYACIECILWSSPIGHHRHREGLDAERIKPFCKPTLAVNEVFGNPVAKGTLETERRLKAVCLHQSVNFGHRQSK